MKWAASPVVIHSSVQGGWCMREMSASRRQPYECQLAPAGCGSAWGLDEDPPPTWVCCCCPRSLNYPALCYPPQHQSSTHRSTHRSTHQSTHRSTHRSTHTNTCPLPCLQVCAVTQGGAFSEEVIARENQVGRAASGRRVHCRTRGGCTRVAVGRQGCCQLAPWPWPHQGCCARFSGSR